jgi:hypothetical protein
MPSVLGEVIIDATASDLSSVDDPVVLVRHIAGLAVAYTPDHGELHQVQTDEFMPYISALPRDDGQPLTTRANARGSRA